MLYIVYNHRRRKLFDFGGAACVKVKRMRRSEDASQRCTCTLTGSACRMIRQYREV